MFEAIGFAVLSRQVWRGIPALAGSAAVTEIGRRTAAEAAREIADALAAAGLPHAIGGALALGVAGVPRGTKDVDVNVFVDDEQVPHVIDALSALGIEVQREAALARARRDGMFVGMWDGMRIDVFVPSIPFSHEAARTAVTVTPYRDICEVRALSESLSCLDRCCT